MRFFCEFCGGPNDSVGRCLRRCEAESRGPRRSAYTSAEVAAYNAGAAAGYKQAEARIKELEAHVQTLQEIGSKAQVERNELEARLEAVKLEAVKALHYEDGEPTTNDYGVQHWCVCGEHYPCPTRRAAEGKP